MLTMVMIVRQAKVRFKSDEQAGNRPILHRFCFSTCLHCAFQSNQNQPNPKSNQNRPTEVFSFVQLFCTVCFKMVFFQSNSNQNQSNQTKIKTHPLRCACVLSNISSTNTLCSARRVKDCSDPSYRFPSHPLTKLS